MNARLLLHWVQLCALAGVDNFPQNMQDSIMPAPVVHETKTLIWQELLPLAELLVVSSFSPVCLTLLSSPLLCILISLPMWSCLLLFCVSGFLGARLWQLTEVTVYSHLSVNHRSLQGSTHRYFSILWRFFTITVSRTMRSYSRVENHTYVIIVFVKRCYK